MPWRARAQQVAGISPDCKSEYERNLGQLVGAGKWCERAFHAQQVTNAHGKGRQSPDRSRGRNSAEPIRRKVAGWESGLVRFISLHSEGFAE